MSEPPDHPPRDRRRCHRRRHGPSPRRSGRPRPSGHPIGQRAHTPAHRTDRRRCRRSHPTVASLARASPPSPTAPTRPTPRGPPPGRHSRRRSSPQPSRAGAVLVTLGNLYGYAAPTQPMRPSDPLDPPTDKGAIRVAMWRDALAAHEAGRVRAIEARASDFIGPGVGKNGHMGDRVVPRVLAGKGVSVLGDPDAPHSWTAIDDVARTLVRIGSDERAWGRRLARTDGRPASRRGRWSTASPSSPVSNPSRCGRFRHSPWLPPDSSRPTSGSYERSPTSSSSLRHRLVGDDRRVRHRADATRRHAPRHHRVLSIRTIASRRPDHRHSRGARRDVCLHRQFPFRGPICLPFTVARSQWPGGNRGRWKRS